MLVYIVYADERSPWHMLTDRDEAHALARWWAHQGMREMSVEEYDLSAGQASMMPHRDGWTKPASYFWADTRLPKVTTVVYHRHGQDTDVNYFDAEHGGMALSGLLAHGTVYKAIADRIKQGHRSGTVWVRDRYSAEEVRHDFTVTDPLPAPQQPANH